MEIFFDCAICGKQERPDLSRSYEEELSRLGWREEQGTLCCGETCHLIFAIFGKEKTADD